MTAGALTPVLNMLFFHRQVADLPSLPVFPPQRNKHTHHMHTHRLEQLPRLGWVTSAPELSMYSA